MTRLRDAPLTGAMLLFIAIIFLIECLLGAPIGERWYEIPIAPISISSLVEIGSITSDVVRQHEYWRLVSAMFLHGNLVHWFLNSLALFQLGSLYESEFGSRRFLLVYLTTGICASLTSAINLREGGASVGASGAVLGILGALILAIRRSHLHEEKWARFVMYQLMFWAAVNVTLPLFIPVIDEWAHSAGVISGLILGLVLPHGHRPPPPKTRTVDVMPFEG